MAQILHGLQPHSENSRHKQLGMKTHTA